MSNLWIKRLTLDVIDGYKITLEDAYKLLDEPLEILASQADIIRKHYCQNNFDVCTIINIKSGNCSEDCKYCAQSVYYDTDIETYPLLSQEILKKQTLHVYEAGLKRISYVASGLKLNDDEFNELYEVIYNLKRDYDDLELCVSLGFLTSNQIDSLNKAGVNRIHNNLETSEDYFLSVCTTHTYQDKKDTIKKVAKSDMNMCSGGIFGLGENWTDRINLAFTLRDMNVASIPINILNPIKNTPYENNTILTNDEICRIVALYRFINPSAFIRLAGGRMLLNDNGQRAFQSGANAAILGNMLTTMGPSYKDDLEMIKKLGYEITYNDMK